MLLPFRRATLWPILTPTTSPLPWVLDPGSGRWEIRIDPRILFLCRRRIQKDGIDRFEFPLLVLETIVDPSRFTGTIYKVASWNLVDKTKEYQRMRNGYSNTRQAPKLVFVQLF